MGIVAKQSSWNFIFIILGFAIGGALRILLLPYYLSPKELGQIDILLSHAILLSAFLNFGSGTTIVKYFNEFKQKGREGILISRCIFLSVVLALVFLVAILLFPQIYVQLVNIEAQDFLSKNIWVLALVVLVQSMYMTNTGVSNSHLKTLFPVFLTEVGMRIMVVIITSLFYFDLLNYQQLIAAYGIVYLLQSLFLLISNLKNIQFTTETFTIEERKSVLSYASFSTLDYASTKLISVLDILMIGYFLIPKYSGIYSIAVFVATVIRVPARAIGPITTSVVAKSWSENDMENIDDVYYKSSISLTVISGLIFLLIWISIDEIKLFLPEEYHEIRNIVFWLGIAFWVNASAGANGSIILTSSKYKMNLYLNIVLLTLTFITNAILIPKWGMEGAAIATFISLLFFNLLKFLFLKYRYNLQPFGINHVKAFLIYTVLYLIYTALPEFDINFIVLMIVKTVVFGGIGGILIYFLKVSEDINERFDKLINRFLNR